MRSGKHKPENRPYQGRWKIVRRQVLERDGHTCQINLPGCTVTATTVDHITPVALGGEWYDDNNLRAACHQCNSTLGGLTKKLVKRPVNNSKTNNDQNKNENPSRNW